MNKDEKLEVFNDGDLKGLCYETIAELAKESIRLGAENRRLEEENENLKKEISVLEMYKGSKQAAYENMQRNWNLAIQEKSELRNDLKLAEQLINGLLQEFGLSNYDWRYDQNEIHTLLKDKFNHNIKALDKIEKIVKKATDLPCFFSDDCANCTDKLTKNGDTCIQGAIFKIADIIKKVKN